MRRSLWLLCGVCVLAMSGGVRAANKYVVPPGTPGVTPDGLYESWGTAATSLQQVVVLGSHTIWVTNGHYYLTNQVTVTAAGTKIHGSADFCSGRKGSGRGRIARGER